MSLRQAVAYRRVTTRRRHLAKGGHGLHPCALCGVGASLIRLRSGDRSRQRRRRKLEIMSVISA